MDTFVTVLRSLMGNERVRRQETRWSMLGVRGLRSTKETSGAMEAMTEAWFASTVLLQLKILLAKADEMHPWRGQV